MSSRITQADRFILFQMLRESDLAQYTPEVLQKTKQEIEIVLFDPDANAMAIAYNTIIVCNGDVGGYLMSGNLYVKPPYQGKGIAQQLMEVKLRWFRKIGWRCIAIVSIGNEVENHILAKYRWSIIGRFEKRRIWLSPENT